MDSKGSSELQSVLQLMTIERPGEPEHGNLAQAQQIPLCMAGS